MCSTILLTGGAHQFPGFAAFLQHRLSVRLAEALPSMAPLQVEVQVNPREMDPRMLAWKGGSVLARLESAREFWVTSKEWTHAGVRILRDRVPFVWL